MVFRYLFPSKSGNHVRFLLQSIIVYWKRYCGDTIGLKKREKMSQMAINNNPTEIRFEHYNIKLCCVLRTNIFLFRSEFNITIIISKYSLTHTHRHNRSYRSIRVCTGNETKRNFPASITIIIIIIIVVIVFLRY